MTAPKLAKGYTATCAKGHRHDATPHASLPATCRYPRCGEPLIWKVAR